MAVTGQDLFNNLKLKANAPLSGNITNTKANQFFYESLINLFDKKYVTLEGTKAYDELKYYIRYNKIFNPSNTINADGTYSNQLFLNNLAANPKITDYLHLLTCKVQFNKPLTFTITAASNTSPIRITIKEQNNLRSTDWQVTYPETYIISGILGNTNANGVCYLKQVNQKQFDLYSDVMLTIPKVGNGIYGVGSMPKISKMYYHIAVSYPSVEEGSQGSNPTCEVPSYQIGDNSLVFYPNILAALETTVSYVSNDIVLIDTADTTTDLLTTYTQKTLLYLTDMAADLYGSSVRDISLKQIESGQESKNP